MFATIFIMEEYTKYKKAVYCQKNFLDRNLKILYEVIMIARVIRHLAPNGNEQQILNDISSILMIMVISIMKTITAVFTVLSNKASTVLITCSIPSITKNNLFSNSLISIFLLLFIKKRQRNQFLHLSSI